MSNWIKNLIIGIVATVPVHLLLSAAQEANKRGEAAFYPGWPFRHPWAYIFSFFAVGTFVLTASLYPVKPNT